MSISPVYNHHQRTPPAARGRSQSKADRTTRGSSPGLRVGRAAVGRALVAAALLALALTAPASAESIAYVQGGQVFLLAPDGSRSHQVTAGEGGYEDVTQGEDGTLVVQRGNVFQRVSADGRPLGPAITAAGAVVGNPALSPDGRILAVESPGQCSSGASGCQVISYYDTATGGPAAGWSPVVVNPSTVRSASFPSWLADGRVLYWELGRAQLHDGRNYRAWMEDPEQIYIRDGDINPAQSTLVAARGLWTLGQWWYDKGLRFYTLAGPPPAPATPRCQIPTDEAMTVHTDYAFPTLSPDGRSVAWEGNGGIHIMSVPDLTGSCATGPQRVLPGASSPDWGPAKLPGTAPPPPPPPPCASGASTTGCRPSVRRRGKVTLRVTPRQRVARVRSRGLLARLTCSASCRYTASLKAARPAARRLKLRKATIKKVSGTLAANRSRVLTLRLPRSAAARLRKAAPIKFTVEAYVRIGGNAVTSRRSVTVVR